MTHMFEFSGEWERVLREEIAADYFKNLTENLSREFENYSVFPPKNEVLRALELVDFPAVKVCILGQDPYHGKGQANGLAFAVHDGNIFPPSLVNIFKELKTDIGCTLPNSGALAGWAKQGVLLLNTTLTVRESSPTSHAGMGWERFTDAIISALSGRQTPLVFILWGASAIAKAKLISTRHHILTSPHPSPLSAYRGFFGSRPFSKANEFLTANGQTAIDWTDIAGN